MTTERIRIALQKSGRLAEDSIELLKNCGLHIARSKDQLFCRIKELPIDVLLVRDDDIPNLVNNGICDLGIVGDNVFAEVKCGDKDFAAKILARLGFSRCRLSIAVPENGAVKAVADLEGKTIATSYPNQLQQFLGANKIQANTLVMTGSVEVAPRLKIADAICDIVASGATLTANNLRELTTVLQSEALLIRAPNKNLCEEKQAIVQRLLTRMRGVAMAEDSKYIMLNAPKTAVEAITRLLPGCDSPTIMNLSKEGMVAIHAVCKEAVFWDTMEKLKEAGGSGILVLPIEKMMA